MSNVILVQIHKALKTWTSESVKQIIKQINFKDKIWFVYLVTSWTIMKNEIDVTNTVTKMYFSLSQFVKI